MNNLKTTSPLTDEERHRIKRWIFLLWKLYKGFLISIAIVFGGGWLLLLIETIKDNNLEQAFIIVSVVVVILFAFGWWTTPIYKKQSVRPLQTDLEENIKYNATGQVVAVERVNKYKDRLIFKEQGELEPMELLFDCCGYSALSKFPDVFIKGKEINLQYLPNSKVIIYGELQIPLTAAEMEAREAEQRNFNGCAIFGAVLLVVIVTGYIAVSLDRVTLKNAMVYGGLVLMIIFVIVAYIIGNHKTKK